MGGTGKTMLVKQISCQVSNSKLFEPVIMAVVGQNPDINNIQKQLSDMLGFEFKEETEQGRAVSLRNRIQKEKKILVIIDDVWNGLDFERVGIPFKGSKIIVTSRSRDVLFNDLRIEKNFKVGDLTEEESWNLFKNTVDESIETNNQLKDIAKKVANKCGKLPLALVIVAKALKGKPLHTWKNALRQLNNPADVEIDGVSKEVYASLNMSYGHLKSREARSLFLLCSMFPDDCEIGTSRLLSYTMGLKFLQGVDTLAETRDKMLAMVDDLESSCFLQKFESQWNGHLCVKMHDVIRDFAIHIASKDDQMCTLSYGKGSNNWQVEMTCRNYTAIFATFEDFNNLPKELNFSKLKLLALLDSGYDNKNSLRIPEDCFERKGNLEVLHLEGMSFSPSPSSFNHLANLRTLLVIDCHLGNIHMIGKLKNLEILDFSRSNITELPLSLSQLTGLKQLKVSICRQLKVIQPEVISRMTKLEELFLNHSFSDWEMGESNNCEQKKAKASISELGCLPCLTCLYICIPDVRYPTEIEFLNNLELERFQIVFGKKKRNFYVPATERMLDIKYDSRNDVWKELLKKCDALRLEGTSGVKEVVNKLNTNIHLTYLMLEENEDVEYLASELDPNLPCDDLFSILETLILLDMRRLETIIKGYSFKTFKVFEKLKILTIWRCDKMKYFFPFSIIEGLSNLESIEIINCEMMEAIVVIENEAVAKIHFRRLKQLKLKFLPELKSFCGKLLKAKGLIENQSSEIVEVKEDQRLFANSIISFHCQITFPNLESLSISSVENVWHDLLIGNNIEKLSVNSCKDIESVFTLKNIETVCNLPEDEFRWMPKLESLKLRNLPNLKQVSFPSLKLLEIFYVNNLEIIWHNRLIVDDISNLQSIELDHCKSLKSIFTSNVMSALKQLDLRIRNCDSLEQVFEFHQMLELEEHHTVASIKLRILFLCNLPSLKRVWSNDSYGIFQFQDPDAVEVINCPQLIPLSIARDLPHQLQHL